MKKSLEWLILVIFALTFLSCSRYFDKREKILYINSYHQGYGSSDDITEGIMETVDTSEIDLRVIYMDSKNNPGENFLQKKAGEIINQIENLKPDVIITSDDNAAKYVVEPYLKEGPIPVVFCGVNWSADDYGLPNENVTGILEILPVKEGIIKAKEYYPDIEKVFILSENTLSEKKNIGYITKILEESGFIIEYGLADTFEDWKKFFIDANDKYDVIFMPTNGGIKNWNSTESVSFVRQYLTKPVVTCDDFMMAYSVIGVTKIQKEQGLWAAEYALKILNGTNPSDIPVRQNSATQFWINPDLADILNFRPDPDFLEKSKIYTY